MIDQTETIRAKGWRRLVLAVSVSGLIAAPAAFSAEETTQGASAAPATGAWNPYAAPGAGAAPPPPPGPYGRDVRAEPPQFRPDPELEAAGSSYAPGMPQRFDADTKRGALTRQEFMGMQEAHRKEMETLRQEHQAEMEKRVQEMQKRMDEQKAQLEAERKQRMADAPKPPPAPQREAMPSPDEVQKSWEQRKAEQDQRWEQQKAEQAKRWEEQQAAREARVKQMQEEQDKRIEKMQSEQQQRIETHGGSADIATVTPAPARQPVAPPVPAAPGYGYPARPYGYGYPPPPYGYGRPGWGYPQYPAPALPPGGAGAE